MSKIAEVQEVKAYYNEDYFKWQNDLARMGAELNLFMFKPYVRASDRVIDFGCGGGHLLSFLEASEKLGIEINPSAREVAKNQGIRTVESSAEIEENWADVIVSSHALEHCPDPMSIVKGLYRNLKPGGTIVLVVPYERKVPYAPNDVNQHLFTWSEMNLGNLFAACGFEIERVEEVKHKYLPYMRRILPIVGKSLFHVLCLLYGRLNRRVSQVRIIAHKPK